MSIVEKLRKAELDHVDKEGVFEYIALFLIGSLCFLILCVYLVVLVIGACLKWTAITVFYLSTLLFKSSGKGPSYPI